MSTSMRTRNKQLIWATALVVGAVVAALLFGAVRQPAAADTPENPLPGVGQAGSQRVAVTFDAPALTFPATSFTGGLTNSSAPAAGGGAGAGKATFRPIVVRHPFDAASPQLARLAATGQHVPSVTINFTDAAGQQTASFRLRDVVVVGDKQFMPDSQARNDAAVRVPLLDEISLAFSRVEWCASTGGRSVCAEFDVAANR